MIPNPRLPIPEPRNAAEGVPYSVPISDFPHLAVLTPLGRGAVATIGVRGSGSRELVGRRFTPAAGKPLESFPVGRVLFGGFRTAAAAEEELVVGLVADNELEIHCHGGVAAVAAVREALVAEGCIVLDQEQWANESEGDPLAAAALVALSHARTERTAAILLDQYRGTLRDELTAIEHLIQQDLPPAAKKLSQLLSRSELGLHLTNHWKVVLAGLPNAGKSSLMNAIVGYERAIVFPQPGTTRDVLTATTALEGWPVELADTAGLREPGDPLEAEGVSRARGQAVSADLVLFVAETTAKWDHALHQELATSARRLLVVHNKCDLAPPPSDGRPVGPVVSAANGQGIENLCKAIADFLVPQPPAPGTSVPFTPQQIAVLRSVSASLEQGDVAAALRTIRLLLSG
jgi:tRNA modification GTPase